MPQSVAVLIFDPKGKVLVLRRGPTDPWKPGHWNFPGGMVEPHEKPEQAAVREVKEEAGIPLKSKHLNYISTVVRQSGGHEKTPVQGTHIFWVRLRSRPKVRMRDGEHDAARWSSLGRLPLPVIPGLHFLIQQITGKPYWFAENTNYGDSADYQKALGILRSPEEVKAIQEAAKAGWESGYSTEEGSTRSYPVPLQLDQMSSSYQRSLTSGVDKKIEDHGGLTLPSRKGDMLRGKTLYWIPAPSSNYTAQNRTKDDVNFIVIHTVEGASGFSLLDPGRGASAHYLVQTDGDIVQTVDEKDKAWHAGNGTINAQSIGLEHAGFSYVEGGGSEGGMWGDTMLRSSAKMVASIAKRWDVPINKKHIVGHVNVGGQTHTDPGPYWPWNKYLRMVWWYRYRGTVLFSAVGMAALSAGGWYWYNNRKS